MDNIESPSDDHTFFRQIVRDDGVQRAAAGVVVAVIVAGAKGLIFGGDK